MSNIVIKAENLSKQYRIGTREAYKTFRETLVDIAKAPIQQLGRLFNRQSSIVNRNSETIWALKDVSFEVERGEVVGIIGRNGAGKTTLLKILSRITEPTKGRAELRGRVGSLLEVGTGFHSELTGHENIYLYGAILGMDRWEVTRKFDEIVAFAELEKFVDTPIKRYSTGMSMRLAFAVAAHLEPEILLVDEVLAVGDAAFQKKCLGKMDEVAGEGRTVLFVSHNMGALQVLCNEAILIRSGALVEKGRTQRVVQSYLSAVNFKERSTIWNADEHRAFRKNEILTPVCLALRDQNDNLLPKNIYRNQDVYVILEFDLHKLDKALTIGIRVFNQEGFELFRSLHTDTNEDLHPKLQLGRNVIRMKMPMEILNQGNYRIVLDTSLHNIRWLYQPSKIDIAVEMTVSGGRSSSPYLLHKPPGIIAPIIEWKNHKYA